MSTHNICRGDSNEYPQHMFLWRTDINYPLIIIKYPSYLSYWKALIADVKNEGQVNPGRAFTVNAHKIFSLYFSLLSIIFQVRVNCFSSTILSTVFSSTILSTVFFQYYLVYNFSGACGLFFFSTTLSITFQVHVDCYFPVLSCQWLFRCIWTVFFQYYLVYDCSGACWLFFSSTILSVTFQVREDCFFQYYLVYNFSGAYRLFFFPVLPCL